MSEAMKALDLGLLSSDEMARIRRIEDHVEAIDIHGKVYKMIGHILLVVSGLLDLQPFSVNPCALEHREWQGLGIA